MYLGIDCGTQGTKALVVTDSGVVLGRGYAPHQLIERSTGAREQEPQWWVDALRSAVRQALEGVDADAMRALAVSGQQHGLVVLDEAAQVIRPAKLWNDTETAAQNAALIERFGGREAFMERFGILPLTGYTVSKLWWLAQHEPENFARIRHILLPHDYLNLWLTGTMCAEAGDASGTGFFDVRTRRWIPEILAAISEENGFGSDHLTSALPRLIGATECAGLLRRELAEELGLPDGCMVAAGGGDNMMGAIGTANVCASRVTLSLGTSATVYSFQDAPMVDRSGSIAPFCASSGGHLPLVCTMNCTNVVTRTVELVGRTVEAIDALLEQTEPGAGGLVFLPFLNGERTPDLPTAQGSLHGVTATNLTAANLVRAAVEGVTFGILNGLDRILAHVADVTRESVEAGEADGSIVLIGGGARSAAWRQMIADTTGVSIEVPEEEESGCLGAAIQAAVAWSHASGDRITFQQATARMVRMNAAATRVPQPHLRSLYRQARARYQDQLQRTYPHPAADGPGTD